jgi:hypothetical protein
MKILRIHIFAQLIRKVTILSGLPSELQRLHSFLFSLLCEGTVDTGEVRPADMLGSEFSGNRFGEFCVITVWWDET